MGGDLLYSRSVKAKAEEKASDRVGTEEKGKSPFLRSNGIKVLLPSADC